MPRKRILAIDPGTTESGFVWWDGETIGDFGKIPNEQLRLLLYPFPDSVPDVVIEEINPYTMGMSIRDTILWSGRFEEAVISQGGKCFYIPRREVIKHLCGVGSGVGDAAVKAALRDRFAYGVRNYGKGIKKEPGFFYGFAADVWQAFALAVTFWDQRETREG